jgi:membrane protease YdiL (CAAX protease family)
MMKFQIRTFIDRHGLTLYFILTYAITYGFSSMASVDALKAHLPVGAPTALLYLLHYAPSAIAILLVSLVCGRDGVKRFLGRLFEWRVGWHWYAFILLYPLAARLAAAGIHKIFGGQLPAFFQVAGTDIPAGNPFLLFVPVFIGVFLQAGLAEEICWRGYALPRWLARFGPFRSSFILALIWAL